MGNIVFPWVNLFHLCLRTNLEVYIPTLQQILVLFARMLSWKGLLPLYDFSDLGRKFKDSNEMGDPHLVDMFPLGLCNEFSL